MVQADIHLMVKRILEGRQAVRKGRVSSIDTSQQPHLFTVEGRPMPMLGVPGSVAVGDLVAWVDQQDPIGLGPFIGS